MARVDFVISNDRHHVAMIRPVIERLTADPAVRCRVLSLCEFRGLRSPSEQFQMDGVAFESVLTRNLRWSPALGKQTRPGHPGLARRLARGLAWTAILRPPLSEAFRAAPDLVVMLNDAAKAVTNFSSSQLRTLAGKHSTQIKNILGPGHRDVVAIPEDIVFLDY